MKYPVPPLLSQVGRNPVSIQAEGGASRTPKQAEFNANRRGLRIFLLGHAILVGRKDMASVKAGFYGHFSAVTQNLLDR